MATHYCVGNPCWICYPEYAPKQTEPNYHIWNSEIKAAQIPDDKISGYLINLLIDVFKQGLDEGTHHFKNNHNLNIEDLKKERANISSNSFEAKLIDLMIEDFESGE